MTGCKGVCLKWLLSVHAVLERSYFSVCVCVSGMEEEATVPFHEHVFLQRHLDDGFPQHGPVRHFMELVVTGLSKNPHLTVSQKQEHIAWFRDYFLQKREILSEAEA